jgi:hypothetical protein
MKSTKRSPAATKTTAEANAPVGRKGPFGNILHDDPYTAEIQGLLRRAKSADEEEARTALLELFYRFHLRLPLVEKRLRDVLPWNREPSRN